MKTPEDGVMRGEEDWHPSMWSEAALARGEGRIITQGSLRDLS
jgi:hypothetical protein